MNMTFDRINNLIVIDRPAVETVIAIMRSDLPDNVWAEIDGVPGMVMLNGADKVNVEWDTENGDRSAQTDEVVLIEYPADTDLFGEA